MKKTNNHGGRGFSKNDPRHQMTKKSWKCRTPKRLTQLSKQEKREREARNRLNSQKRLKE